MQDRIVLSFDVLWLDVLSIGVLSFDVLQFDSARAICPIIQDVVLIQ